MAKRNAVKKAAPSKSWAEVISAHSFTKQNFDGITEAVINIAESGLSSDKCNTAEKNELAAAVEIFVNSKDVLIGHFGSIQPEDQKLILINALTRFLLSIMAIGHFKLPSRKLRDKVEEIKARELRAQKAIRNQPRKERLENYLRGLAEKETLHNSDKYAESLRAEKDFKSAFDGAWPSTRTIRRYIGAILTECGRGSRSL
jgi:hypothetical protein